jgi:hypothetical protein
MAYRMMDERKKYFQDRGITGQPMEQAKDSDQLRRMTDGGGIVGTHSATTPRYRMDGPATPEAFALANRVASVPTSADVASADSRRARASSVKVIVADGEGCKAIMARSLMP